MKVVAYVKDYKDFRMVTPKDLEAAMKWAEGLQPENPEDAANVQQVNLIRDVITTGLSYAVIVAKEMGGLPCFDKNQTPEQRKQAMAAAAKLASRPRGGGKRGQK